jgi:type I restriction enzyme S subunit
MSEEASLDEFAGQDDNPDEDRGGDTHPRFGRIPPHWRIEELAQIAEVVGGSTPSTSNESYWDGGIPWATPTDLTNLSGNTIKQTADTLTQEGLDSASTHLLPSGSVLMTSRATIGECAVNETEMATNQGFKSLVPGEGINTWYLHYRMLDTAEYLKSLGSGSTFDEVSKSTVQSVDVPLPPLPEQRKIATVLHTVDRAIEKTEEVTQQLRKVKQGILQDLTSGAGSDSSFEKKRIGPRVASLPKDWEVVQIGDALDRNIIIEQQDGNHGSDYPRKNEFVDDGVPYLSAEMLSEGRVDFSQAKYLTEERANQLRVGFAQDGDVLLAHNATVGPAGKLRTTHNFVIIGTSLTYYRCNSSKLDGQYLAYFFQSSTFQRQLQDIMRQSTRNQVPITRQRNLYLLLPPIQQQKNISNQIDAVSKKIQIEKRHQKRLQRLKQGLMQDLLSGEVRTTDKSIEVPDKISQHG